MTPAPWDEVRWSIFHPLIPYRESSEMRHIPIFLAGITRRSIMIQTCSGALWRALPKCLSSAGLPLGPRRGLGLSSQPPPGMRVVLPRHTDIFMHFNPCSKQGVTSHWGTWLLAGGYHMRAIQGQPVPRWGCQQPRGAIYHLGADANFVALPFRVPKRWWRKFGSALPG